MSETVRLGFRAALQRRPSLLFLLAILLAALCYSVATLDRVPAFLHDDDGGYASAAYQIWQTGEPGIPGYGDVDGLNRHCWSFGRIAAAAQGVFLHFFGVSIFGALLPSFIFGLGLLLMTALLGRALWDAETGIIAASILGLSGKFFEACRWARPDMLLALFFVTALWLAATADGPKRFRNLLLAGLVMGFAGDVHLNGFLLAPVPLVFWLLLRRENVRNRSLGTVLFMAGGAVGVAWWIGTHYLPHPSEFRAQWAIDIHGVRLIQFGVVGALKAEIRRYTDWFWAARGHRHLFEGVCVFASGIWLLMRGGRVGRAAVYIWLLIFVIAVVFMLNTYGWYLIFVWPIFALWIGRTFVELPTRRLADAALVVLVLASLADAGLWAYKARLDVPLEARVPELRELVPADAPVLGNGALWFAFWDRDFTDVYYLRLRELTAAQAAGPRDLRALWENETRQRGWRYIVAYGDLTQFLDPSVSIDDLMAVPSFREREAEMRAAREFSVARCEIVHRMRGYAETILVLRVK
jgi:4-amino-4-deoxy-L-arabinose transferase-like glycosyltransferase